MERDGLRRFMSESWREARLIPTSGIKGATDQEVRATSTLLSVISVIPSFAHSLLKPLGAPLGKTRANVDCFIEVAFEDKKAKSSSRPDGLIRVTRGSEVWTALVEVKTQSNPLSKEQVETYMDVAREQGFNAVITISNEIPPIEGAPPMSLDRRKLRSVPVHHFSWVRIISIAIMEREVHGIEDPEQSWILGELIRYLEHDNSGTLDFTDMGPSWPPLMEKIKTNLARRDDSDLSEVAVRFDGLIRYMCLKFSQRLGTDVVPVLSRNYRDKPETRVADLTAEVEAHGTLSSRIRIPGTVADIEILCDLRARQIVLSSSVPASGHARNASRMNWLIRPLSDMEDVVIEAQGNRRKHAATLRDFREEGTDTLPAEFPSIGSFRISKVRHLGLQKTTSGKASFINSVLEGVDDFYATILQQLKLWTPPAPKFRPEPAALGEDETYSSAELLSGKELATLEPIES
jgi:hypothetical protein